MYSEVFVDVENQRFIDSPRLASLRGLDGMDSELVGNVLQLLNGFGLGFVIMRHNECISALLHTGITFYFNLYRIQSEHARPATITQQVETTQ